MASLPQKILIVRLGAIGDVTQALVLATALADSDASVHIGWAVHEGALPLVEGHPAVRRVHVWKRGAGRAAYARLVAELQAERYGAALDLQRIAKSAWLARRSGAPRRIGFDRARCKEWSFLFTNEKVAPGGGVHRVDGYLDFARHLGVRDPRARFALPEVPAAAEWAERLVAELGAAPILLNLGATKPANRWSPTRFGDLARRCRKELARPVCLIGSEVDRPAAVRALALSTERDPVVNLAGRTSLPQLWELLRRAALVVTCDTGPMHLARAVGAPIVGLFGASDPAVTGPYPGGDERKGPVAIVRVPPPCSPCERRDCNRPRHDCMEDITVALAFDAVARALEAPAPARAAPDAAAT